MGSRQRKTNSRYEDGEFILVQFLEDEIFHVLPSVDVTVEDNEKVAKYKDNKFTNVQFSKHQMIKKVS